MWLDRRRWWNFDLVYEKICSSYSHRYHLSRLVQHNSYRICIQCRCHGQIGIELVYFVLISFLKIPYPAGVAWSHIPFTDIFISFVATTLAQDSLFNWTVAYNGNIRQSNWYNIKYSLKMCVNNLEDSFLYRITLQRCTGKKY